MGMAQNSSSTPARISTSTVQAVQVTIFSSERCEGQGHFQPLRRLAGHARKVL